MEKKTIRVKWDNIKGSEINLNTEDFPSVVIEVEDARLVLDWGACDAIFRHMRKYYEVEDLKQVLDEMTDEEKEELSELTENPEQYIDEILDRYHTCQESHETWNSDMRDAIDYTMR